MTDAISLHEQLQEEVGGLLVGMEAQVELLTISALTRGHILVEGVPGVAKTSLAQSFARASGLDFNRIQMTPDVLPADITGTKVYREHEGVFELQRGPIFANVVVADEINRTTPNTQSALLEAMEEARVSIEGETLDLPNPFIVVATQNPLEMEGTFELPEAQRDRFQLKITVDLPSRDDEVELMRRFKNAPQLGPEDVSQVVDEDDIERAREVVEDVYVDPSVEAYIIDIVEATRTNSDTELGASPRATLAFLNTARARAAISGREYVIPDDVKRMTKPILDHRLVLRTEAVLGEVSREGLIDDIVSSIVPPGGGEATPDSVEAATDG